MNNPVFEKIKQCVEYVKENAKFKPKVGLVLGSGLGNYARHMRVVSEIPYSDIPGFPVSTVKGHDGKFLFGYIDSVPCVIMKGRIHYYEGYSMSDVVLPVRVMSAIGVEYLVLTNAVGAVNKSYKPGDFMVIEDHISSFIPSPLIGENLDEMGTRFPDMSDVYNKELRGIIDTAGEQCGINLQHGILSQFTGPQYESKAEVDMMRILGADACGMSTVCEAIAAHHAGIKVCGISFISNMACGAGDGKLDHKEVQEMADAHSQDFETLISAVVSGIGKKMEDDRDTIERFIPGHEHSYKGALAEIENGRKESHWMWYIFPQLRGLGMSDTAWWYGIKDLEEAKEYIEHPILGAHLLEITEAVLKHAGEVTAAAMFGFPDDLKLRSCMTLFELVSNNSIFGEVLDAFYDGKRDENTLELLKEKE